MEKYLLMQDHLTCEDEEQEKEEEEKELTEEKVSFLKILFKD